MVQSVINYYRVTDCLALVARWRGRDAGAGAGRRREKWRHAHPELLGGEWPRSRCAMRDRAAWGWWLLPAAIAALGRFTNGNGQPVQPLCQTRTHRRDSGRTPAAGNRHSCLSWATLVSKTCHPLRVHRRSGWRCFHCGHTRGSCPPGTYSTETSATKSRKRRRRTFIRAEAWLDSLK